VSGSAPRDRSSHVSPFHDHGEAALPETPESTSKPSTVAKTIRSCHVLIVLALATWLGLAVSRSEPFVGAGWMAFLVFCALLSAAASWRPVVAIVGYVLAAYTTPRYGQPYAVLMQTGGLNLIAIGLLCGWIAWLVCHRRRPGIVNGYVAVMLAFVVWLGISAAVATAGGQHWHPHPNHHPLLFFQALALFLLAGATLRRPHEFAWLGAAVCAAVLARALVSGRKGIDLEGDISALSVMAMPLAVLGVQAGRNVTGKLVFVLMATGLVVLLALTRNRASAVGFVVLLPILWWHARRRWRIFAVALPVLLIAGTVFFYSSYWERFAAIWQGGEDANSVRERLMIWRASRRMIAEHPVFGVGTGNFHNVLRHYEPKLAMDFAAHNSAIHVLAEAGFPGLMLYAAVFAGGLTLCWRTWRRAGRRWPAPAGRMLFASLVVYLTVGMFISRHDLPLAYLLCGAALGAFRAGEGQGAD